MSEIYGVNICQKVTNLSKDTFKKKSKWQVVYEELSNTWRWAPSRRIKDGASNSERSVVRTAQLWPSGAKMSTRLKIYHVVMIVSITCLQIINSSKIFSGFRQCRLASATNVFAVPVVAPSWVCCFGLVSQTQAAIKRTQEEKLAIFRNKIECRWSRSKIATP